MYINTNMVNELLSLIKDYNTIIIHRHIRPDPDAFGSQIGLKHLINHRYPDKKILLAGSMPKGLSWMGTMDEIVNENYQNALVIITDTANQERIDDQRYTLGDKLVKIDHHPPVEKYGDLQIVATAASSCSEIIVEISNYLEDKLPMTQAAAEVLYAGIVGDTGRFMFDSTSKTTFLAAATLVDTGIDIYSISDRFNLMSKNLASFQGHVLENLVITEFGVAYFLITRDILDKFQISEEESNKVVNLPGMIEGVYSWVMFVEEEGENDKWRIRLRSKGPIINELASRYQGGGHPKASGAKARSIIEIEEFIRDLNEITKDYIETKK